MNIELGGNKLSKVSLNQEGEYLLGENPYKFLLINIKNKEFRYKDLKSFTVFIIDQSQESEVICKNINKLFKKGDVLQIESSEIVLNVKGNVSFIVSGRNNSLQIPEGVNLIKNKDVYKVKKPWGNELWLSGKHPSYALKEINLNAGFKTSLQYHELKRETIVLFKGKGKLHYKQNDSVGNDNVSPSDLGTFKISKNHSLDVWPKVLHRMEAISNITFYETSTPELDDVIRVEDDSNRLSGKILDEHPKNSLNEK